MRRPVAGRLLAGTMAFLLLSGCGGGVKTLNAGMETDRALVRRSTDGRSAEIRFRDGRTVKGSFVDLNSDLTRWAGRVEGSRFVPVEVPTMDLRSIRLKPPRSAIWRHLAAGLLLGAGAGFVTTLDFDRDERTTRILLWSAAGVAGGGVGALSSKGKTYEIRGADTVSELPN